MSDLIDRQAAIDAMCELMHHWFGGDSKDEVREIKRELEKLSAVQSQPYEDAVSRQQAIAAVSNWLYDGDDGRSVDQLLSSLPSAQPKRTDKRTETHACDLISRAMLLEYIHNEPVGKMLCDKYNLDGVIKQLPAAQSERKKGRWIERNPQNSDKCRLIECDQCGFSHIVGFNVPYEHWIENRNFCERCGADMRGDAERKDGD